MYTYVYIVHIYIYESISISIYENLEADASVSRFPETSMMRRGGGVARQITLRTATERIILSESLI